MIADLEGEFAGSGRNVVVALPAAAQDALRSAAAVSEMADAVGQLALDFGMGQPLKSFQALLKTYQTLAHAHAALCGALQHFLPAP